MIPNVKIDGADVLFVVGHNTTFSRDEDDGILRIHTVLLLESCRDSEIRKFARLLIPPSTAWALAGALSAAVSELPAFEFSEEAQ